MKKFYYVILALALIAAVSWGLDSTRWVMCVCVALLVSVSMGHYAIRNVMVVSYRKKIFDVPDSRRVHATPTPRLGGLVFAPIILCASLLAYSLHYSIAGGAIPDLRSVVLMVPVTLLWMVGCVDDLIGVNSRYKFVVQIAAAVLVVYSGFWVGDFHGFLWLGQVPDWVGMASTVVLIVAVINAFNMIDGIDGLASGLFMLALAIYGGWLFAMGHYHFSLVAISAVGVLAPFFYTNVRGLGSRKHKMFMGDTGSLTLGMIASILAIVLIRGEHIGPEEGASARNLVTALSPLFVPLFDMVHVTIFRLRRGQPAFKADKSHIHHRLMNKGFKARGALAMILTFAMTLMAVNWLLVMWIDVTLVFVVDGAIWIAFNSWLMKAGKQVVKIKKK